MMVELLPVIGTDYGTIDEIIIKLNGRCNLACRYCFEYEMADQSYLRNPNTMSREVILKLAERIGEHVLAYALPAINLVIHGGEPLMAGMELIELLVSETRRHVSERTGGLTRVNVTMQTNGVLLNEGVLGSLDRLGVRVGISLDGGQEANDRNRVDHSGRGTFSRVARGIELMRERSPEMFAGILCVIDLENDPVETYKALAAFDPPVLDFLLPLGHWDAPPPGLVPGSGETPYADWLIRVFEYWGSAPASSPVGPPIRLMMEILRLSTGLRSYVEMVGEPVRGAMVVNTAGEYEMPDALKSVKDGIVRLGVSIFDTSIHEANLLQMRRNHVELRIKASSYEKVLLCPTCDACQWRDKCGGGYYPHRWSEANAMWNPSVYCDDLKKLFAYMEVIVRRITDPELQEQIRVVLRHNTGVVHDLFRQRLAQLEG
jgi:uncharacterized protein